MDFKHTSPDNIRGKPGLRRKAIAGLTIPEFLIASAIAGLILGQLCLLWLYSSRSFAAQMTYADMDQRSQRALDTLTKNIRQCKGVTNFYPTRVTFVDYDNIPLTFSFEAGTLKRIKGTAPAQVLLKDCKAGQFLMYQRNPIAGGFDQYPTTDPNLCKLMEVRWVCSKKLVPTAPTTTESMQSARIALRVK